MVLPLKLLEHCDECVKNHLAHIIGYKFLIQLRLTRINPDKLLFDLGYKHGQ
jgi:hypothetical protein